MFKTSDFYLACYLMHLKVPLLAIEPVTSSRVVFHFERFSEDIVLNYYNREPLNSSFLDIVDAIRHTREMLYSALENSNK